MIKVFAVFQLSEAVSGFSSQGIEYDSFMFILYRMPEASFKTEKEAEEFVIEKMKDYSDRKVGKNTRFVILPTYIYENNDEHFQI